jgi:hypothetical protein
MPGEVVGIDRKRGRIILVEADGVAEIGPEFAQNVPHALEDEIALAAASRPSEHRKARWACHLRGDAACEVESLVPGQKNPRPSLDRIGVANRGAQ